MPHDLIRYRLFGPVPDGEAQDLADAVYCTDALFDLLVDLARWRVGKAEFVNQVERLFIQAEEAAKAEGKESA